MERGCPDDAGLDADAEAEAEAEVAAPRCARVGRGASQAGGPRRTACRDSPAAAAHNVRPIPQA